MPDKVKTPKPRYLPGSFQNAGTAPRLTLLLEQQQKIEIGQRVKWLRDNSAETSRSIATYCDVTNEAVRNWIAGKGIKWDNAVKVGKMFKIDVDWVWRGEGQAPDGYPVEEREETPDPFLAPHAKQLDRIEEGIKEILREVKGEDDEGGGDLPPEPPGPLHPPSAPSEVEPETPKEAQQQQDE